MNIINILKLGIKKILYRHRASSNDLIKYMRKKGANIGNNVFIYDPLNTTIDMTRPWLINIGNDVHITKGVTILTHGFDWCVLKNVYGDILGSSGAVTIGNNVFIGVNTTILKGVTIGNNVIIGANSLVNRDIPDNCVVCGNPAKVIMSIEEYYQKRKNRQNYEASELSELYIKRYNKYPDEHALHEFFWLFTNDETQLFNNWHNMMKIGSNYKLSYEKFKSHTPLYSSYDDFIKNIKIKDDSN